MPRGNTVTLTIHDVGYRGPGVARLDGKIVFCPGTLEGEGVTAVITEHRKQFDIAKCVDVQRPSPHRVAPACPQAGTCPGCAYQHATYDEELRIKTRQLIAFLGRVTGEDPAVPVKTIASPQMLGYRNKLVLQRSETGASTALGYVGHDNRTVLDIPECPLASRGINDRLEALRGDPAWIESLPPRERLTIRETAADGVIHWTGKLPGSRTPPLSEHTALGPLEVPAAAFFQVNPGAAALLIASVSACIADASPRAVLDAYCGVGVFACAASRQRIEHVIGFDSDRAAIRAARKNAARLGVPNLRFENATAELGIGQYLNACDMHETLVIVDPPRSGLTSRVLRALTAAAPAHILYVSCAPDTLARDASRLRKGGYTPRHAMLIDMFPRTAHFETMLYLQRDARKMLDS